jgi:hypothetical protein
MPAHVIIVQTHHDLCSVHCEEEDFITLERARWHIRSHPPGACRSLSFSTFRFTTSQMLEEACQKKRPEAFSALQAKKKQEREQTPQSQVKVAQLEAGDLEDAAGEESAAEQNGTSSSSSGPCKQPDAEGDSRSAAVSSFGAEAARGGSSDCAGQSGLFADGVSGPPHLHRGVATMEALAKIAEANLDFAEELKKAKDTLEEIKKGSIEDGLEMVKVCHAKDPCKQVGQRAQMRIASHFSPE